VYEVTSISYDLAELVYEVTSISYDLAELTYEVLLSI